MPIEIDIGCLGEEKMKDYRGMYIQQIRKEKEISMDALSHGICSFSNLIRKNQEESIQSNEKWIHSIQNFGYNFDVIKNYQRENWMQKELDEKNRNLCDKQLYSNGLLNILSMINDGIGQWMFFGTILFGVLLIHVGGMKVGTLISIVQASNMVVGPITGFMSLKNRLDASKSIKKELNSLVDKEGFVEKKRIRKFTFYSIKSC